MRLLSASLVVLALSVPVAGCDDHDHDEHEHEHETGLVPGTDDMAAQMACDAFATETPPAAVSIASTPGTINLEAGLVRFALEPGTGRTIEATIPQHTSLALFTDRDDLTLIFETDDGSTLNLAPTTANASCPDAMLIDQRMHIHTVGPHIIHVPDEATGELGVYLYATEVGH